MLYSITFGFFSSGYSATWGGMLKELERDSSERNEAVDSGMVYGILNGVSGIGYASGGFASIALLKAGTVHSAGHFGYGTTYGPLIISPDFLQYLAAGSSCGGGIRRDSDCQ